MMNREEIFKKHENTIYGCAFTSGIFAITSSFVPGADIPSTITSWSLMLVNIADDAGRSLDKDTALKIATAIAAGGATYLAGCKLLTFSLHLIPGIGTLGSVTLNVVLSALCTIRLGRFIALQMEEQKFNLDNWDLLLTELSTVVFAMPTLNEFKDTLKAYQEHKS
jgi:uncharacterized protein (DUF697 family)